MWTNINARMIRISWSGQPHTMHWSHSSKVDNKPKYCIHWTHTTSWTYKACVRKVPGLDLPVFQTQTNSFPIECGPYDHVNRDILRVVLFSTWAKSERTTHGCFALSILTDSKFERDGRKEGQQCLFRNAKTSRQIKLAWNLEHQLGQNATLWSPTQLQFLSGMQP